MTKLWAGEMGLVEGKIANREATMNKRWLGEGPTKPHFYSDNNCGNYLACFSVQHNVMMPTKH